MTTIYTDCLAALHAHLDAHPADWQARLVLTPPTRVEFGEPLPEENET